MVAVVEMRLCNCAENLYGRSIKVNEIGSSSSFSFSFDSKIVPEFLSILIEVQLSYLK